MWLQPGKLQEEGLLISKRCFADHFPDFQLDTLTTVVKRMMQEEEERMSPCKQQEEPTVTSPLEPKTPREDGHSGRNSLPSLPSSLLPLFINKSMRSGMFRSNQHSPQKSSPFLSPRPPVFGDGSTAPDEHRGSPVSNGKEKVTAAAEDVTLSIPDMEAEPQRSAADDLENGKAQQDLTADDDDDVEC